MKIIAKIFAILKIIGILISILAKLSCVLAGPFLVFVVGCGIYSAVIRSWRNLMILAVVAAACIVFYLLVGVLLGGIDIAGSRMKKFLRS